MDRMIVGIIAAALACVACPAAGQGTSTDAGPAIHIEDVERFYRIYDAADGQPTAEQLQRDYLDPGSKGLHHFAKVRNITGARIADTLSRHPGIYSDARRCMAALPRVRERVDVALRTLSGLYPQARLPSVTVAVGRGKPVGVGNPAHGLQIGLEALCATEWLNPDVEDRFVHVIVHEYVHVQQAAELMEIERLTVLQRSLLEGVAEFIAELVSGKVAYSGLAGSAKGREGAIETAFVSDVDKTDLSQWIDNSTTDQPGDLGYWVGYRIVKAYYQHAPDKRAALREILQMTDAKAFLARSGWHPGIALR